MYSPSFTQPPSHEQLHSHHQHHPQPHPNISWYPQQPTSSNVHANASAVPFQSSALSSQQHQQIDYLLHHELQQHQYHSQDNQHQHLQQHYPHQQHSQHVQSSEQPYSQSSSPQPIHQYPQSNEQQQVHVPLEQQQHQHGFQSARSYSHQHHETEQYPAQYWHQHQHQHQHQSHQQQGHQDQAYVQQHFNPSEVLPVSGANGSAISLDWSNAMEYSAKGLIVSTTAAPKGLNLLPIVVSPAQLHAHGHAPVSRPLGLDVAVADIGGVLAGSGDDNDSVAGTEEDDHRARLQLSEESYISSSTPPLSPHMGEHHSQGMHIGLPPRGLIQSMAGLSTTSPVSPGFGPSHVTSLSPGALYGAGGHGSHYNSGMDLLDGFHSPSGHSDQDGDVREEGERRRGDLPEGVEEERLYQCAHCQKRFLRQYNLNAHLKTHSVERHHRCDECPKSFLRPYDLSRHQRIHSKDKPYSCKICGLIFIRNDAIWRHYRKVHHDHPDVPTSRRDKKKQRTNGMIGALVTPRVVYAPTTSARSKSKPAPRKTNSKTKSSASVTSDATGEDESD